MVVAPLAMKKWSNRPARTSRASYLSDRRVFGRLPMWHTRNLNHTYPEDKYPSAPSISSHACHTSGKQGTHSKPSPAPSSVGQANTDPKHRDRLGLGIRKGRLVSTSVHTRATSYVSLESGGAW